MKIISSGYSTLCGCMCLVSLLPISHLLGQAVQDGTGRGVVIITAKDGPTRFLDSQGKVLSAGKTAVGSALPEGNVAQAGVGGKIVLLLSNGTVTTLESQTKLKIREFSQEPFDAAGRKISDLKMEPSKSSVKLDLDWGSIVVTTKKLDRASSLQIQSPSGTAGIRGTQFRLAEHPGAGTKLDVTESTVTFTPKGGGQSVAVGPGKGLDISSAGVVTPRAISPLAAKSITATNAESIQVTDDVLLSVLSEAMGDALTIEDKGLREDDGADPQEDGEPIDQKNKGKPTDEKVSSDESTADKTPAAIHAARQPNVDAGQVLENNPAAKQVRKLGKANELSLKVASMGLSDDNAQMFYSLSPSTQNALLAAGKETANRLLGLPSGKELDIWRFLNYSRETRVRLLALSDDQMLLGLIRKGYEESSLVVILSDENLQASNPSSVPLDVPEIGTDSNVLELSETLKESGNSAILNELLQLGGGELTPELERVGEVANLLLTDFTVPGEIEESVLLSGNEVLSNPFYREVSSVYGYLEDDLLVAGEASFLGGRNVEIPPGAYRLAGGGGSTTDLFVFSASEKLKIRDQVSFAGFGRGENPRVVLMSGGSLETTKGVTLDAATNDLVLSVRRDVLLQYATLKGNREVTIRSLRDLTLRDSELDASGITTLKATQNLYIDGLNFSRDIPKIVMEASTIRLMNIDFPSSSNVNLNSLKGPIDGRYPNFGTDIPMAQQLGRVNFLQNIKSGGNLMHDRSTFDQFGGSIKIGKLP
jgi:hypothetical protein